MVPPLYTGSVPVFRHYLGQAMRMIEKAGPEALAAPVADGFPAGQQFATAAGFALRVACPLAGRDMPSLPTALAPRLAVVREMRFECFDLLCRKISEPVAVRQLQTLDTLIA